MRNYSHIDNYLSFLLADIYPQPPDPGHTTWAIESISEIIKNAGSFEEVLDVGCGQGFCQEIFESYGKTYQGVALGEDVLVAKKLGKNVEEHDFSFLPYADDSFDFIYARHALEHSPMPLLTLMEWERVSSKYIALVLPAAEHWKYGGRNHYFVLDPEQWKVLFNVAGLEVKYEYVKKQRMGDDPREVEIELWYLLEKNENTHTM